MLPALCSAGSGVTLSTLKDGSTIARNASGSVIWQSFSSHSGTATPATATYSNAGLVTTTGPTWDPLTELDSSVSSEGIAGPIFDSLGNAWVVINDSVNLMAVQSNGTTGTWLAPRIIGPSLPGNITTVGMAVDQAGGFYVTYGTAALVSDASQPLMLAKYTPSGGWQAPIQIYTSSNYFDETFPSIDSTGRLVVVFNANGGQGSDNPGILSIASNPAQTSWGPVQTISPSGDQPILPSVASNPTGTRLALVFLQPGRGLRYTFFNSNTGQWNAPAEIPGSLGATFSGYSTLNAFPIAVDASGNVTLASAMAAGLARGNTAVAKATETYTVEGFRYQGGGWTSQQLITPTASLPSLESFASIALNASGAALIAAPLSDGSTGVNIDVFRYTPGQGWDTEIAASYNAGGVSRCKVAWFESTEALVVYSNHAATQDPLLAAFYSNGAWGTAPAIPGNPANVAFPALSGAPNGLALLGIPTQSVYATFLRP